MALREKVRSATMRPGYKEPLSRTEKFRKDELMRQFVKGDGPKGYSKEYVYGWSKIDWSSN